MCNFPMALGQNADPFRLSRRQECHLSPACLKDQRLSYHEIRGHRLTGRLGLRGKGNSEALHNAVRQTLRIAGEYCCAGGVGGQHIVAGGLPIGTRQDLCVSLCLTGVYASLVNWCLAKCAICYWRHICA